MDTSRHFLNIGHQVVCSVCVINLFRTTMAKHSMTTYFIFQCCSDVAARNCMVTQKVNVKITGN